MIEGLKPCIWCKQSGCDLEFDEWLDPLLEGGVYVKCFYCQARGPTIWYSINDKALQIKVCINQWNTRTEHVPLRLTQDQKALIMMRLHYNLFAGKAGSWIEANQLETVLNELEY